MRAARARAVVQEPGWRAGAPGRWVDTVYSVHRPELDKLLLAEGVEGRRSAHGMILHHPHLVCDARDEVLVVRNKHHRPREALNAVGKGRDRFQVEVVGWFIKHEHVRLCVRDGRQRHAGALAAGQGGARHILLPLGHAARRQVRPQRLLVRERAVSREAVHHELEGREGQVELVGVMLVDEADARAGVAEDLAGGWLQLAQQKLDESRLAVTILAEQHDPGFGVDAKLCAREELAVLGAAVAEAHSLHLDQVPAELAARLERERQFDVLHERRRIVVELRLRLLQLLRLLLLHLHLVDLGRGAAVFEPVPSVLLELLHLL
mmetsp:Transcript_27827/g.89923  ORF Transcript_27827/g.89923 Transcript_27827/m.89923 type:complete len:321 (-) Transcript_27827:1088-2050(-)